MNYRKVKLIDIADVERVKKDKTYPKNTIYIQVSACNRHNDEKFMIAKEEGTLETKYAVIKPKVACCPFYMKEVCNLFAEEFYKKYVGTNINIQMDSFNYFTLKWHDDYFDQIKIASMLSGMQEQIDHVEKQIDKAKQIKEWHLDKMFPKR